MKENIIGIVKFVLLLLVVCVFILSCTPKDKKVCETKRDVFYYKNPNEPFPAQMPVTHFTYKEHDYIMFGGGEGKTIVHNPDCHCNFKY